MNAKWVLHHDDPPCNARLRSYDCFCPGCEIIPDMQSTCFRFYCPMCDIQLREDMRCPRCEQTCEIE